MSNPDEEFALLAQWHEARSRFVASKADTGSDEYKIAKKEMGDLRRCWRKIRDAVQAGVTPESTATPDPVQSSVEG